MAGNIVVLAVTLTQNLCSSSHTGFFLQALWLYLGFVFKLTVILQSLAQLELLAWIPLDFLKEFPAFWILALLLNVCQLSLSSGLCCRLAGLEEPVPLS